MERITVHRAGNVNHRDHILKGGRVRGGVAPLRIEGDFNERVIAVVVDVFDGVFYKMVKSYARAFDRMGGVSEVGFKFLGADDAVFAMRVANIGIHGAIFINIKKRVFLFMEGDGGLSVRVNGGPIVGALVDLDGVNVFIKGGDQFAVVGF